MCIRVRGQVVLRRSVGYSHGGGPSDPHGAATQQKPDQQRSCDDERVLLREERQNQHDADQDASSGSV